MKNKIIFFNTGWMDFYNGVSNLDTLKGGGKHVEREGWGGEIMNFKNVNGRVYGYVQPKIDKKYGNYSTIKLEKLGAAVTDEKIDNITVVWTAKDPYNRGTYIVGWYLNATVFRYEQPGTKEMNRKYKNKKFGYFVSANAKDINLLSSDKRIVRVHRAKKNWMGQSNVWYAEHNPKFKELVNQYIFYGIFPKMSQSSQPKRSSPRQTDVLKRIEVETKAIKFVTKYYQRMGFSVESVEADNVGWDLTAINSRMNLKLEVKGLSGDLLSAELTPNEFKCLESNVKSYRLCIVTEALSKFPRLRIFAYSLDKNAWTSEDGTILKFQKIIGAKVYI